MQKLFYTFFFTLFIFSINFAQQGKGIDSQTQKITENKTITNGSKVGKEFSWGKDKTKTQERFANPYRLNARRDVLVQTILDILEEKKLFIDEASSKLKDGIIVTQPFIFAKGVVTTKNELFRYADLPNNDAAWTRGRYSLTIEVQSVDGIKNNVAVTAKIEGRTETGLGSEWVTVNSNGEAENEFIAALVEVLVGNTEEPK
jgi:hypothetical protein